MLMLLMTSTYSFAQSDPIRLDKMKQDIIKTNKFYLDNQLDLQGYDFSNDGLNKELNAAVTSMKKSSKKASVGGIFIGIGLATVLATAAYNSEHRDEINFGYSGILFGTAVGMLSIPFFISAGKHNREAKKHIMIAREMYGG